jgi:hypothetical protein
MYVCPELILLQVRQNIVFPLGRTCRAGDVMVMESTTTCAVRKDRASLCSFVGLPVPHEQRTSTKRSSQQDQAEPVHAAVRALRLDGVRRAVLDRQFAGAPAQVLAARGEGLVARCCWPRGLC